METFTDKGWLERQKTIVSRMFNQPTELDPKIRREFERRYGETIYLFGFVDLNSKFELESSWILVGETVLALGKKLNSECVSFKAMELSTIDRVEELQGLSSIRVKVFEKDEGYPAICAQYTLRQNKVLAPIWEWIREVKSNSGQPVEADSDVFYNESLASPVTEAQSGSDTSDVAVIWRLIGYLKPYKYQVLVGLTGSVLMTVISLVPAYLAGYLIDKVIKPFESHQLTQELALKASALAVLALLAVYLLKEFFAWLRLSKMSVLGEYVAKDLRDQVYSHLQKLGMNFFSQKSTGSLISRVSSDTDRIWDFVAFGIVEVLNSILLLTGLGAVLIYLDLWLGLLVTIPIPIFLWCIWKHGHRMQGLFLRAWRKWSNLTDCLSGTIPGIKVVKAFGQEKLEIKRFKNRNKDVLGEFNRIHKEWTSFWPLLMFSIHATVLAVWLVGVPRVLGVEETQLLGGLSVGTFVSFILYLTMYIAPIEIIGQMARMVNRATSSAYRVFEILDTLPTIVPKKNGHVSNTLEGQIEFENVRFSYDKVRPILKGVSFNVKPGEMIGLVGPSGSGKSTITNLIARFYDITSGNIKIEGIDLKDWDIANYRSHIGMVLQDPYLFHGSLLDNIRYAKPEAGLSEVVSAAKAANAHDFICKLPHGYETMVGERGLNLSGGERQRVSIARAVLRNPKILILDEATSSVDTETERKIQDALDQLVKGRTVIAIAHRLSTLTRANRILVIKDGLLVEEGQHSSLVNLKNGVYAKLCKMQNELHNEYAV